jgi:hypothetical protein
VNSVWLAVSWEAVRASGFTAYLLVTASAVLGLLLSLRWQSRRWPRLVTNEMHNFVTLLALAFGMVHGLLAWLDPFTRFGLAEVLVPLVSHYRPLWMAFGIVTLYMLIALLLSTWLRPWIGYRLWRVLHVGAFLVFVFATIHGVGTGSDTRTVWGAGIYAIAVLAVLSLTVWRLLKPAGRRAHSRPGLAALAAAAAVVLALWAMGGPLKSGWNAIANNGHGSGARVAVAAAAPKPLPTTFSATFSGTMTSQGDGFRGSDVDISMTGSLTGGATGSMAVLVSGQETFDGVSIAKSQITLYDGDGVAVYRGTIGGATGQTLKATVSPVGTSGTALVLSITWQAQGSSVTGQVSAHPASATAGANNSSNSV